MNNAHIFYLELAKAVIKAANYDKSVTLWVMGVAFGPKDVPEALSEVREYFLSRNVTMIGNNLDKKPSIVGWTF